jgi:hypothetical protein
MPHDFVDDFKRVVESVGEEIVREEIAVGARSAGGTRVVVIAMAVVGGGSADVIVAAAAAAAAAAARERGGELGLPPPHAAQGEVGVVLGVLNLGEGPGEGGNLGAKGPAPVPRLHLYLHLGLYDAAARQRKVPAEVPSP